MCEICERAEALGLIRNEGKSLQYKVDRAIHRIALLLLQGKPVTQHDLDEAAAAVQDLKSFEQEATTV